MSKGEKPVTVMASHATVCPPQQLLIEGGHYADAKMSCDWYMPKSAPVDRRHPTVLVTVQRR
ncbi:hypothetical protein BAUCODRAFT_332932 [Baudoinia panamericana UAMH 10762]|uniref:Uncharacterized protein n=1 Tax=Baudoinia panamericana (strain UAMH 10762) TaxID=717646 RepID=M2MWP3_BAUPA|nr:uncharacterized protein BAUCODRAFT_332932 [Baudoinia panamericana UAMH 10762]EMC90994.1 hypothetical protein BAUCODRAFT_332932 [Baudoinia panamericana UAMH 10762]